MAQEEDRPTQSLILLNKIVRRFLRTSIKSAHAAVTINNHLEILPINGTRFKHWLRKIVRKEFNVIVRDGLLNEVVEDLASNAAFDGQVRELV